MKKIILLFTAAILMMACSESELDLNNPNKITAETFWKTQSDLESGLSSAYYSMIEFSPGAPYWGIQTMQMKEARTENFYSRNDVGARYDISMYKETPSNSIVGDLYSSLYTGIFRTNQVLYYADGIDMDATEKATIVAEAKFLRGLYDFILAIEYKDAPLITTLIQNKSQYFNKKSTQAEIYAQVEKDLTEAIPDLPKINTDERVGRASQASAIGLLGKVYLYEEKWADAQAQFESLVKNESSYGLGLLDNYAELFDGNHENSKEAVFEIQFSTQGGTDIWTNNSPSRVRSTTMGEELAPPEVGGWNELWPTQTLLNAMLQEKTADGEVDPRAYATLAWNYKGCVFYNKPFAKTFGENAIWIRKCQNWWNDDEGDWKSTLDEYAMRYADVLLMLAESYTMQDQVAKAAPLVQRIRTRAKLADTSATMATWDKATMMQEIMHQRNVEFAREGFHFYDLRRWGTLQQVIKDSGRMGSSNYTTKFEYYPIPEAELDNNPNMIQNDAWKSSK